MEHGGSKRRAVGALASVVTLVTLYGIALAIAPDDRSPDRLTTSLTTGFKATDKALKTYGDLQLRHKLDYVIFKIVGDRVDVESSRESSGASAFDYNAFVRALKSSGEPRYGVMDYPAQALGGQRKVVFVSWNPPGAKIRPRTLYAATKEAFKDELPGLAKSVQANDDDDLDEKEIASLFKARVLFAAGVAASQRVGGESAQPLASSSAPGTSAPSAHLRLRR